MSMATPLGPKAHTGSAGGAVALCGVGAVTGYGWGHKLLVEGLLSGETALRPTPAMPAARSVLNPTLARLERDFMRAIHNTQESSGGHQRELLTGNGGRTRRHRKL